MKPVLKIAGLLLAGLVLVGWQNSFPGSPADDIVGKWSKDGNIVWELKPNGTYQITFGGGVGAIDGKYTVRENQLTITDQHGSGVAQPCGPEEKGVYTFSVKDKVLTLKTVNEMCEGRGTIVPGTFKRN